MHLQAPFLPLLPLLERCHRQHEDLAETLTLEIEHQTWALLLRHAPELSSQPTGWREPGLAAIPAG